MIYLDHNATTAVLPEVFEAMRPYFCEDWGNPSSTYRFGSKLKRVLETAREQLGDLVGAHPREVIFTSCATESNNAAIHSALTSRPNRRHIITSQVEHSSVLSYCRALEREGWGVTYLPVDRDGLLSLADLDAALGDQTAVVSLMWANNETGVIFPVEEIGQCCHARGVLFHCDAVQAVGKMPVVLKDLPVDYLSISGHKLHAPKGIGALYVHRKAPFSPYLHGGHQERGRRGGTESVPLVVGLGVPAAIARKKLPAYDRGVRPLRDALEASVLKSIHGAERNGHPTKRLANTANLSFPGIESEALLLLLDQAGLCASSGSACLADSPDPSHVIAAMKPGAAAHQSVRFSLGPENTGAEIRDTIAAVERCVATLGGSR